MEALRKQHKGLIKLFEEHEAQVCSLQKQAIKEIVPDVAQLMELDGEDVEWITDYLRDVGSFFRMFRRQKFIAAFTHEIMRNAVLWRLDTLKPAVSSTMRSNVQGSSGISRPPGLSALRCLPLDCTDNFGRPIAVIRVSELEFSAEPEQLKRDIILSLERLRVTLQRFNDAKGHANSLEEDVLVLQYVIIVDLENVSVKSIPIDLVKWYLREVQPWYHGLVGAAFLINYNWAHSGLWSILKRILPASAIAKVAFPQIEELAEFVPKPCFSRVIAALHYPPEQSLDDSLSLSTISSEPSSSRTASPSTSRTSSPSRASSTAHEPEPRSRKSKAKKKKRPSRFSVNNPFYGYPIDDTDVDVEFTIDPSSVSDSDTLARRTRPDSARLHQSGSIPTLRHGRRRKRDLVATLLVLYWQRWKLRIGLGMVLVFVYGAIRTAAWVKSGRARVFFWTLDRWVRALAAR